MNSRSIVPVEQMLAARKQLAGAQSDKDKEFYTDRCDGLLGQPLSHRVK